MKKIKFKGFSIAELLIVLAIIGIIATMGVTITKKSTQNAYNLYIYTGYKAIYEALANSMEYELPEADGNLYNPNNSQTFFHNVLDLLDVDVDEENITNTNSRLIFSTPNNITYQFDRTNYDEGTKQYYQIIMTVPTTKTRENQNGQSRVILLFAPQESGGIFAPIDRDGFVQVQNNAAILPFKIENGNVKGIVVNGENTQYVHQNRIRGLSYKEAMCRTSGRITIQGINIPSNCNGIAPDMGGSVAYLDKHPNLR